MELKKNDIIELSIHAISSEGSGVGKTEDGIAVFVPQSAVGDKLKVKILKVKKTHAFGKIEKIIEPSDDRIESVCSVSRLCGGCVYNHISYEAELSAKEKRVADAISRIGGIDTKVNSIVGAPNESRYRNKAQIPVGINSEGKAVMGFYSRHSHRIVDSMDCALQPEVFLKIASLVRDFVDKNHISVYNEEEHRGLFRHLYIRYGEATDEPMVCIVINGKKLPFEAELVKLLSGSVPNIKSIIINSNREKTNVIVGKEFRTVFGNDYIEDILCGLKFRISPQSFYQVNRTQSEKLYSIAGEYAELKSTDTLIDLYCGTGTIGLSLASKCKSLIGVEIVPEAIENAKENAERNSITNARFICGDAAKAAEDLKNEGITPDVVIIDPPRKGCESTLIHTIKEMNPQRVVYVSCDPATLARDLKIFDELGYKTLEVTPVDMFPRTAHVESVAKLFKS
ncbi:MAG: 23S rRNA (uracil(1939)-C(5))-methyltransferase RlmD [Ruminococcus sp.]|nr:23S rRNA (uracil(1939)-C(5))-methyltransferase RlmD [Ruminococcus sp.]